MAEVGQRPVFDTDIEDPIWQELRMVECVECPLSEPWGYAFGMHHERNGWLCSHHFAEMMADYDDWMWCAKYS